MVFYATIFSFLVGVFVSSINLSWIFVVPVFFILIVASRNFRMIFIVAFFAFGFLRAENVEEINNADFLLNKNTEFSGIILKEPDKRELNTHYVVDLEELNVRVRLTTPHFPRLKFGERIVFKGKLQKPEKFKNENDISFDYPAFLAKDGIAYVMFYPQIISHEENKTESFYKKVWYKFYSSLIFIKEWFADGLRKNLKEPQGALASGILIGSKQALGAELLEYFRRAGLIHLVVLSGYNVTIIADAIRRLFSSLPILYNNILSIFFIISFSILTGASATTIRASIMAIIAIFAQTTLRKYEVSRALWVAAFFMVLQNPKILTGDPGFQLSFLATLGLIHVSPKISSILKFIPEKFGLRENISSTIATQITVLPLLIKMTGEISVIALLANILVLPIVPITMAISAVAGAFSFLGPISKIISYSAYVALTYIIFIAEKFSNLSFAVLKIAFYDTPI